MNAEEKAYLLMRSLSSTPANALSAEHYRQIVGVDMDYDDMKSDLIKKFAKMVGGMSNKEVQKVNKMNPEGIEMLKANFIGEPIVDQTVLRKELLHTIDDRSKGIFNEQPPAKVKPARKVMKTKTRDDKDIADGDYWKSDKLPSYKRVNNAMKGGKIKKPNKSRQPSGWQVFSKEVSKWPALRKLGKDKMKAISILYKELKNENDEFIRDVNEEVFDDISEFKSFAKGYGVK